MFVTAALTAVLAVGVIAIRWRQIQDNERADICARAVAGREDNRAMWVWLLTRAEGEDPNNAVVDEAHRELDKRIPALMCDSSNNPVPVPTTTTPGD